MMNSGIVCGRQMSARASSTAAWLVATQKTCDSRYRLHRFSFALSDSYIRDIEKYGSIGDEIKVKVISIDAANGFLRVSYKKVPEEERYSTHVNEARIYLEESEKDFSELEKKLPIWIEETLKR